MTSYYTNRKIQTSYHGWFIRPNIILSLSISLNLWPTTISLAHSAPAHTGLLSVEDQAPLDFKAFDLQASPSPWFPTYSTSDQTLHCQWEDKQTSWHTWLNDTLHHHLRVFLPKMFKLNLAIGHNEINSGSGIFYKIIFLHSSKK